MGLTVTPEDLDLLNIGQGQYAPSTESEIEQSLDRITDQLHSKRDGGVISALQNLHSMTVLDRDGYCAGAGAGASASVGAATTARQVAKYVIQNYNCVRDMIAAIYTHRSSLLMGRDGGGDEYYYYDEGNETICNLSLDILNNCMQATAFESESKSAGNNTNTACSIDDYDCKNFIDTLVPSLVSTVTNYNKNTHAACLAMKCLSSIAKTSSIGRGAIQQTNVRGAVEEAQLYGSVEYLRLEEEADQTMRALALASRSQQVIAVA